jgi:calcineurin-like phosphoesterase family protein
MKKRGLVVVADLFNGKRVLINFNKDNKTISYRYLTDKEAKQNKLDKNNKNHTWFEAPLHTKRQGREQLRFATIEATPIVLHRSKIID